MRNKTEGSECWVLVLWLVAALLLHLYHFSLSLSSPWSRALYYIDISSYNGPITALNTIRPAIDRKYIKRKYHLPRKKVLSNRQKVNIYGRAWSDWEKCFFFLSFYFAIFPEDTGGISLPIVHLFLKVFKNSWEFSPARIPENNLFSLVLSSSVCQDDCEAWRGSSRLGESTVTESQWGVVACLYNRNYRGYYDTTHLHPPTHSSIINMWYSKIYRNDHNIYYLVLFLKYYTKSISGLRMAK